MNPGQMSIRIEGLEELQKKAGDLFTEPLKELLEEAASLGVHTAIGLVEGGTFAANRSIQKELKPGMARVYTAMPFKRAMSIEEGRTPGTPVVEILAGLIRWKEATGYSGRAIDLAKQIEAMGVRGKFFIRGTRQKIEGELPRMLDSLKKKIEDHWGKK